MPQDKTGRGGVNWEAILSGEAAGPGYDRLREVLQGAAGLYGAGLAAYLRAEKWGLRRRTRLPVPVVSIGNLSVGGTGKTPMTQYMARVLAADGWHPAILSRGYRGMARGRSLAVSDRDGNLVLSVREAGDEPYLLAASLPGIPVIVGKDRRKSGRLAVERFRSDVLLLDDGFQYWQLARDLDIVLLDARRPFENGFALPRGLLREPKSNLSRASIVLVTRAHGMTQDGRTALQQSVSELAPQARIFWASHRAGNWKPMNAAAHAVRPVKAVAFCGIAQPDSFLRSVQESGVEMVSEPLIYSDHQHYGVPEITEILGKIRDYDGAALITTEKDAVKLDARSLPVPVYALEVRIEIEEAAKFQDQVSRALITSGSASAG